MTSTLLKEEVMHEELKYPFEGALNLVSRPTLEPLGRNFNPGELGEVRASTGRDPRGKQRPQRNLEHVIRTRIHVVDVASREEIARVHGSVFGKFRPATIIMEGAGQIDSNALIAIEARAIVPIES